ncbi:minor tail protein [Arthrobacter phage Eileen]|uniref:Minor tail protein n=2 Tax=Bridgettevirus TaxID=2733170 RepID=A0A3G2KI90_9CAUD|nr:minor tail protein [Arthrobacter phage Eileen]YP_009815572.1 minor tail protein [Arthrobacter phage Peas]AYN57811.1 minor tail protein [Arthrobacter phage Eileen]AYN58709.1 minor tail protein [Arthrobacter phage Peas]
MPQTRPNGTVVPINSDEYNLTPDLATMADSIHVRTTVADKTERDLLTPYVGLEVIRLDREGWVQTYTGLNTASGWEYKGTPRRVVADVSLFSNVTGTASRLLYTLPGVTKGYPQSFNARARIAVNCGTIASGVLSVNAAVSGNTSTVATAQGKAPISWLAPGAYLQTNTAETGWLNIAAGADPFIRAWIEVVSGTVSNTVSVLPAYTQFYADLRPQDD